MTAILQLMILLKKSKNLSLKFRKEQADVYEEVDKLRLTVLPNLSTKWRRTFKEREADACDEFDVGKQ